MIWDTECVYWNILLMWYPKRLACMLALGKKASDITFFNNYRAVLYLQFQSVNLLKSLKMATYNTVWCHRGRGRPHDAPVSQYPLRYSCWGRKRGRGGTKARREKEILKRDGWQWNGYSRRRRGRQKKPDGDKERGMWEGYRKAARGQGKWCVSSQHRRGDTARRGEIFLLFLQDFLLFLLLSQI